MKPEDKNMKLLIIEDDPEIGKWIENSVLSLRKYDSVNWAVSFSEGIEAIDATKPDVIVLDLKLPDGNGVDILKKIRTTDVNTHIFVFSVNLAMKNTCLRLGANNFFDKITESEKLIETLNN